MGLNGSSEGGITRSHRRSTQSGANDSREKMQACAGSTSSRRNPHASRVHSLCSSRPTWQRHTTRAPRSRRARASPAVCGSWRRTTSPGRTRATTSSRCRASVASYVARAAASSVPASPGTPCNLLWIRLVTAKNSGSPPTTSQRMSTPVPAAYATRVCSISATPPPRAVELTFHTTRPSSSSRAAATYVSSRSMRSGVRSGSSRCRGTGSTLTSATPVTGSGVAGAARSGRPRGPGRPARCAEPRPAPRPCT